MPVIASDLVAADLMTIDPVIVAVDAPIEEAERLILDYQVTGLPVVDEHGALVGVISQTDFMHLDRPELRRVLRGSGRGIRVGEVMSRPAITVDLSTDLAEAARVMVSEHVHRLVVVDDSRRPRGVLSAFDYVSLVAEG